MVSGKKEYPAVAYKQYFYHGSNNLKYPQKASKIKGFRDYSYITTISVTWFFNAFSGYFIPSMVSEMVSKIRSFFKFDTIAVLVSKQCQFNRKITKTIRIQAEFLTTANIT